MEPGGAESSLVDKAEKGVGLSDKRTKSKDTRTEEALHNAVMVYVKVKHAGVTQSPSEFLCKL